MLTDYSPGESAEKLYEDEIKYFFRRNKPKFLKDISAIKTALKYFRNWDWEAVRFLMIYSGIKKANLEYLKQLGTTILHEIIKGPTGEKRSKANIEDIFVEITKTVFAEPRLLDEKNKEGLNYKQFAKKLYESTSSDTPEIDAAILNYCVEFDESGVRTVLSRPSVEG